MPKALFASPKPDPGPIEGAGSHSSTRAVAITRAFVTLDLPASWMGHMAGALRRQPLTMSTLRASGDTATDGQDVPTKGSIDLTGRVSSDFPIPDSYTNKLNSNSSTP